MFYGQCWKCGERWELGTAPTCTCKGDDDDTLCYRSELEAAVKAERNILAAWMIQRGYATGHGDTTEDLLKELEWQIAENWTNALVKGVEGEREECAQLCERMARRTDDIRSAALEMAAENIRTRGNT